MTIAALVAMHTAHGAITVYGGEFVGQPLFCSTVSHPLYYDSVTPPWLALPISTFGTDWQCGDLIYIPGHGTYRALDAGPFGDHCVATGDQCLPIRADMPAIHADWEGISTTGSVINLSAVHRECQARGLCD